MITFLPMFASLFLVLSLLHSSSLIAGNQSGGPTHLTIPASPWTLTFAGRQLSLEQQQIKPDGRAGYFLLSDNLNQLQISMYIEPAEKCKTSKECRDMVWKLGNPAWENLQNVVMGEIGEVSFFEFLIPSFRNLPIQQHMYAQFVVNEFWVDMHISKASYQPKEHQLFEDVIKSVKFEPKNEKAAGSTDSPAEVVRKAADDWMALWDAGNYDRSYEALAQESRTAFTRRQWYVLWYGTRRSLGKVKTRTLERIETGREPSVRTVTYKTLFDNEKAEVRETLALRLEQDGTWRVITYLNNLDPHR